MQKRQNFREELLQNSIEAEQIESMLNMADISEIVPFQNQEEMSNLIKKLERDLQEAERSVEMKERQLEAQRRTCRTLETHLQTQRKKISFLEQRNRLLESENRSLKENSQNVGNSIIEGESPESIQRLKQKTAALQRENARLKRENQSLTQNSSQNDRTLDEYKDLNEELKKKVSDQEIELKRKDNLLQEREKSTQSKEIIAKLEAENLKLKRQFQAKNSNSSESERNLAQLKDQNQQLKVQIRRFQIEMNKKAKDITEYQKIIQDLEFKVKNAPKSEMKKENPSKQSIDRIEVNRLEEKCKSISKELALSKEQLSLEKSKLLDLLKKNKNLEIQLTESNKARQQFRQKCKELQRRLSMSLEEKSPEEHKMGSASKIANNDSEEDVIVMASDISTSKFEQLSKSISICVSKDLDCVQKKLKFLNLIISEAENQLEKLEN